MTEEKRQGSGTLIFDVDGTLCPLKKSDESYADLEPYQPMVEKLKEYKAKGYTILLYTARNMRTHKTNLGLINKHTAPVMLNWLEKWQIPFDEILFGKPWPEKKGFYIDDRSVRPREFLTMDEDQLEALIERDRKVEKETETA